MEIKYFNRDKEELETELVYGAQAVRWLYGSSAGSLMSRLLISKPISHVYGILQDSVWSHKKVRPFIQKFSIDMNEYIPEDGRDERDPYSTFNQFFIRRFKKGARKFNEEPSTMPAFSEARYFGYESLSDEETIPVKGTYLGDKHLLDNTKWEEVFRDGPCLLARLCPVDYHRFHYPDKGRVLDYYPVRGVLHSVNPLALKKVPEIFCMNEREVTILETENFGRLAYVEVGAICVGKIVQSSDLKEFNRGDEKGYFLFGGSTVIVLGEKGKWKPSEDILKYTKQGIETYLKLGSPCAKVITS